VTAVCEGNAVRLEADRCDRLTLLLDDRMMDLDKPVRILRGEKTLFEGKVERTVSALVESLVEKGDPELVCSAQVEVALP
jgi:hypothetical protein